MNSGRLTVTCLSPHSPVHESQIRFFRKCLPRPGCIGLDVHLRMLVSGLDRARRHREGNEFHVRKISTPVSGLDTELVTTDPVDFPSQPVFD